MLYQRLGQMLLDARLITKEQLHTAQQMLARHPDKTMDEILVSCGFLPASAIYQMLEQQLGISYMDLTGVTIPKNLVALVSEIPYNLAMGGNFFVTASRNPVFGLVLGLILLWFYRYYGEKSAKNIFTP